MSGLSIKDGAEVESGGRRFIIMQLIGFDFVVARDIETDDLVRLAVVDLNPVSPPASTVPSLPDLSKVDDRDWAEAGEHNDVWGAHAADNPRYHCSKRGRSVPSSARVRVCSSR